jgi:hypothetical protein
MPHACTRRVLRTILATTVPKKPAIIASRAGAIHPPSAKPVIAPIPVDTTKTTTKLAEATPDRFVVSCHVVEIVFVREV